MKFIFKEHTDKGAVRQANEDSLGLELNTINGSIFVVCDGMGGHVGGAMASSIAVRSILDYFKLEFHENPFIALDNAFQFANTQIFAKTLEDPSLKGMGTTGVILLIRDEDIFIGHVGDSRIYIKSDEQLVRLTKDHSYVQQLVDQGIILDEEAENHPQKNQILKALGHSEEVKPTICKQAIKAKKGDLFLLCSDGQCGMVVDRDMEELIDSNNIESSVENLFNVAMQNGGVDNITNILIKITESTNTTSSFINVGPKREKPKNLDFEKTNAINGGHTIEEDIPTKKVNRKFLFIGLAASLIIGVVTYFLWPREEVKPPPPGPVPPKSTLISKADLEKNTEEEMDDMMREIALGNIPECKDCEPNDKFVKGNFNYSYILDNNRITQLKKQSKEGEVAVVKCKHNNEVGKCEQCTKEKKENSLCQHKNDKNSCQECKKVIAKDLCIHKKDKKSCSICSPNTGDKLKGSCVYTLKSGENYTVLENQFKSQCKTDKKPKIDKWSPQINNRDDLKAGTKYTCNCPK